MQRLLKHHKDKTMLTTPSKKEIHLFRLLRVLMLLALGIWVLVITIAWGMAYIEQYPVLEDLFDVENPPTQLTLLQIILGYLISLSVFVPIAMGFHSVARFLKWYERGAVFHEAASKAVKRLGYALIFVWLLLMVSDTLIELVVFYPDRLDEVSLPFPFDLEVLILMVGILLILLSKALIVANHIKQENDQII